MTQSRKWALSREEHEAWIARKSEVREGIGLIIDGANAWSKNWSFRYTGNYSISYKLFDFHVRMYKNLDESIMSVTIESGGAMIGPELLRPMSHIGLNPQATDYGQPIYAGRLTVHYRNKIGEVNVANLRRLLRDAKAGGLSKRIDEIVMHR